MKVSALITAAGTALIAALATAPAAHAIDFECGRARLPAEKTICAHTHLANLDERTARLYGWNWAAADTRGRYRLLDEQRTFLAERNACRWDKRCITSAYRERMEVLRIRLQSARLARRVF